MATRGDALIQGRREEVIPSAARLLGSLRDLGYDFVNAVADLIDNSISAHAQRVDVTITFDGPDSWIRIADNGDGMSATAITEAMRLGSGTRDYAGDDLGRFGLGLKTASLSQARSITVASRSDTRRRLIDCRQLDLDEVEATDRWEIVHPLAAERPAQILAPLSEATGTVVLWTKLDRILNRADPFGGWASNELGRLAERLDVHLGMVFGRFLSGQARRDIPLTITINGTDVEPWDPFCLSMDVQYLPEKQLMVGNSFVRYRPYVLPPEKDFSDDEARRRAGGPGKWNLQQGFYVYRADRMIQSGGWSRLRAAEEHVKLARAALEFWPDLDEALEINISKMRVRIPEELREQLKPLVTFLCKCAGERYRTASRPVAPKPFTARPPGFGRPAEVQSSEHRPSTVVRPAPADLPAADPAQTGWAGTLVASAAPTKVRAAVHIQTTLRQDSSDMAEGVAAFGPAARRVALEEAAARADAQDALARIRAEIDRTDPEVARDLGW